MKVHDVMTKKVVTVHRDTSFADIVRLLLDNNISGVPVVDDHHVLIGMVTEADLITNEAYGNGPRRHLRLIQDHLAGRDPAWIHKAAARTATDLMTRHVATAEPDDSLAVAARLMLEGDHRRLPVVDAHRLVVGIIARHDLLQPFHRSDDELAKDVEGMLADPLRAPEGHQAESYVTGGIVALTGTTQYPSDIAVLRSFVAQVPGVIGIDNGLTARDHEPGVEATFLSGA